MNARRATLTLGAAAGGLLATAFLQTAVASATPATNAITDLFGFGSGTGAPTDPFGGFFGGLGGLDGFGSHRRHPVRLRAHSRLTGNRPHGIRASAAGPAS